MPKHSLPMFNGSTGHRATWRRPPVFGFCGFRGFRTRVEESGLFGLPPGAKCGEVHDIS
jgi:hypothetical protein